MLEKKRPQNTDLREVFKAYELALSPLTMALGLGFAAYWVAKYFSLPKMFAMVLCAVVGFFLGLKRLLTNHKNKPNSKSQTNEELD